MPETVTLSSTAGPAKWAAVILLAAASGGGLTYALSRQPRTAPAGPIITPAPIVLPAPQPQPIHQPVSPAPVAQLTPASAPASVPQPASQPTAPAPQPVPQPAPVETPAPQPAPISSEVLPGAPAKSPALTHKININKATGPELELLPHIGPAMSKRILDYRALHGPFKSIADLDKVKGIGPKTLAKIAPLVTVE